MLTKNTRLLPLVFASMAMAAAAFALDYSDRQKNPATFETLEEARVSGPTSRPSRERRGPSNPPGPGRLPGRHLHSTGRRTCTADARGPDQHQPPRVCREILPRQGRGPALPRRPRADPHHRRGDRQRHPGHPGQQEAFGSTTRNTTMPSRRPSAQKAGESSGRPLAALPERAPSPPGRRCARRQARSWAGPGPAMFGARGARYSTPSISAASAIPCIGIDGGAAYLNNYVAGNHRLRQQDRRDAADQ